VPTLVDRARFLGSVRLFRSLDADDLTALSRQLREHPLRRGQVLFREGDGGDEMFFVYHGGVVISKAVTGRVEQVLARFETGDFFGEMTLFDGYPRSATAQTDTDTMLLALSREALEHLTRVNPRAAAAFFQALVQVFIERLRASGALVAEVTRWGLEATGLDVDP
jgi:CRP-like cAMP-binding protein